MTQAQDSAEASVPTTYKEMEKAGLIAKQTYRQKIAARWRCPGVQKLEKEGQATFTDDLFGGAR